MVWVRLLRRDNWEVAVVRKKHWLVAVAIRGDREIDIVWATMHFPVVAVVVVAP